VDRRRSVLRGTTSIAVAPLVRADDLAAVICEPVPFSNIGGQEPDHEFMRALRELTRQLGILLIFDEVITGFRIAPAARLSTSASPPDLHVFGKVAAAASHRHLRRPP
jgi:glutamate-1-semialdehyde aminotransferase